MNPAYLQMNIPVQQEVAEFEESFLLSSCSDDFCLGSHIIKIAELVSLSFNRNWQHTKETVFKLSLLIGGFHLQQINECLRDN